MRNFLEVYQKILDSLYFILIWFDLIWFDLIWFDLIWFDLIWFEFICLFVWFCFNLFCFHLFCFNLLVYYHSKISFKSWFLFIVPVPRYQVQALTSEIVSGELSDLILWLLIKDPKRRPNTKDIMNEVRFMLTV